MARPTATVTESGDAYFRNMYHPELLELLKEQIPRECRSWNPAGKYWWISSFYVKLALRLTREFFPDLKCIDTRPEWQRHTYSYGDRHTPPPRPAPPELISAAQRCLAKKYHPDLLPEDQRPHAVALMAQINHAVDQLRERAEVR